ncbi:dihydrofolate reductase family protein [Ectobacillus ponti]|uniref:Dihydrofolate reductase family protein n=1 Tax=Ectobacillus ponti TaxID=2961894 RepID=A0AA41X9J1_9BACI|nr:dihydrofolate reductase family protein [Ectobacillus ponti]MCP8967876.1 dihydrofolate reductase family protein [Ectobacillus ponti]
MSRNVVLYIAASLDGYIADPEDSLDWLFRVEGEGDNGYGAFYETVDTILLGRRTYDWIMEAEQGRFPYTGKECYVFSRTRQGRNEHVTFTDRDAASLVAQLQQQDGGRIWVVGGGDLLQDFLREQLVDELILTVAPVLLGKGIPLFQQMDVQTELLLQGTRRFGQFVELHYTRK